MAAISVVNARTNAVSPRDFLNQVTAAAGVAQGLTVMPATQDSVTISRKVTPGWVIVVCILLFPIGLLALLARKLETLSVVAFQDGDTVRATLSGASDPVFVGWLQDVVANDSGIVAPIVAR